MSVGQRYIEGLQAKRSQTGELARTWQQMQAFQLQQQERERQKDEARLERLEAMWKDVDLQLGLSDEQRGKLDGSIRGLRTKRGDPDTPLPNVIENTILGLVAQMRVAENGSALSPGQKKLGRDAQDRLLAFRFGPHYARVMTKFADDLTLMGAAGAQGGEKAGEEKAATQGEVVTAGPPRPPTRDMLDAILGPVPPMKDKELAAEQKTWLDTMFNNGFDPVTAKYVVEADVTLGGIADTGEARQARLVEIERWVTRGQQDALDAAFNAAVQGAMAEFGGVLSGNTLDDFLARVDSVYTQGTGRALNKEQRTEARQQGRDIIGAQREERIAEAQGKGEVRAEAREERAERGEVRAENREERAQQGEARAERREVRAAAARPAAKGEGKAEDNLKLSQVLNEIQQDEARLFGGFSKDRYDNLQAIPKAGAEEAKTIKARLAKHYHRAAELHYYSEAEIPEYARPQAPSPSRGGGGRKNWGKNFSRLPGEWQGWARNARGSHKSDAWIRAELIKRGVQW